jgi:two-component system sensor histidine kinase HydH
MIGWTPLRAPFANDRPSGPRWPLWGLLAGLASGLVDLGLFWLLGERLHVSHATAVAGVTALFALTSAALGHLIGRLWQARRREQADAEINRAQLAALRASQKEALQNEKLAAIGRLAAGIAHEVRNPLGVIRSSAALVQEGFAPGEDAHRACQFICEEIDRLNGLITSLLTFARPTQPRLQRVALDSVIDRALGLVGDTLRHGRVQLAREGDAATELWVDPDLLAQVLLGLLTNAAEALPQGGRVVLRLATTAAQVQIEVADSGPGLASEHRQRLFEPFFTTKAKGTGLGLAMALRIVQTHRGELEFLNGRGAGPAGAGACFAVRLPRHAPTDAAPAAAGALA